MPTECRKGAPGGWSAIAVATVVLGLLPPDSVAQGLRERRPIGSGWIQDRHAELAAAARLVVRTKGDITIAGSSRESIRYAARLRVRAPGDGTEWVQAALGSSGIEALEREDGALELSLIEPECAGCRLDASVEIQIPESTVEIDLRTPFGDIRVSNVRGSVRALADGGSVDLESIGGAVDVIAAGSVRLENVSGPVNCETRSGRVEVGRVTGPASLRTSVGSLRVESVQGDLDAATGAGSIQVGRVSGTARLATSSGSIQVGDALNGLEADVGAGGHPRTTGVRDAEPDQRHRQHRCGASGGNEAARLRPVDRCRVGRGLLARIARIDCRGSRAVGQGQAGNRERLPGDSDSAAAGPARRVGRERIDQRGRTGASLPHRNRTRGDQEAAIGPPAPFRTPACRGKSHSPLSS